MRSRRHGAGRQHGWRATQRRRRISGDIISPRRRTVVVRRWHCGKRKRKKKMAARQWDGISLVKGAQLLQGRPPQRLLGVLRAMTAICDDSESMLVLADNHTEPSRCRLPRACISQCRLCRRCRYHFPHPSPQIWMPSIGRCQYG